MKKKNPFQHVEIDDTPFWVFVLRLKVVHWWRIDLWLPLFVQFARLSKAVERKAVPGVFYVETRIGLAPVTIQYWRSKSALLAYAQDMTSGHTDVWGQYNVMLINARKRGRVPSVVLSHDIVEAKGRQGLSIGG